MGLEWHQSWRFVRRHFQLYDTSPMIPNWPWAWPCWNCTTSYKFSVSVKKMGEGWTGGASDILKAESSGEDPRATEGLVSNLPHPRVNKTKQHWAERVGRAPPGGVWVGVWFFPQLYYPFGKGPGKHIIHCLENKKCENERTKNRKCRNISVFSVFEIYTKPN